MTKKRILIVEDDAALARVLSDNLTFDGFEVQWVSDGNAALHAVRTFTPDLAVLDLMLPGMSGFELCGLLRRHGHTPIIILSARGQKADKLRGLNLGADDYVSKPFDPDELAARMRALRRRAAGRASALLQHGELAVDPAARTVRRQGQPVELSAREFDVLLTLLEVSPRVLSRAQIEERLYRWGGGLESNAIEVHVHRLRRKLGDDVIRTLRGVGYFVPVEPRA